jgi:hypothetical protein
MIPTGRKNCASSWSQALPGTTLSCRLRLLFGCSPEVLWRAGRVGRAAKTARSQAEPGYEERVEKTALPLACDRRYIADPTRRPPAWRIGERTFKIKPRTRRLTCVSGFAGTPTLSTSWIGARHPSDASGYWVGRSAGRFAGELLSDQGPGLCARPLEILSIRFSDSTVAEEDFASVATWNRAILIAQGEGDSRRVLPRSRPEFR